MVPMRHIARGAARNELPSASRAQAGPAQIERRHVDQEYSGHGNVDTTVRSVEEAAVNGVWLSSTSQPQLLFTKTVTRCTWNPWRFLGQFR